MRLVIALVVTVGFGAWAQWAGGGVWTGYVNGWVPDQPRAFQVPYALPYFSYGTPYLVDPGYAAPPPAWSAIAWQQQAAADQAVESARLAREAEALRRAADEAAARELAAHQAAQELAAQQLALQQAQQLALQQATQQLAAQKAELELAEREAARKAAAAAPPVKGPDVYRWVDGEGVVHYSTRAPSDAKVKAEKVGK